MMIETATDSVTLRCLDSDVPCVDYNCTEHAFVWWHNGELLTVRQQLAKAVVIHARHGSLITIDAVDRRHEGGQARNAIIITLSLRSVHMPYRDGSRTRCAHYCLDCRQRSSIATTKSACNLHLCRQSFRRLNNSNWRLLLPAASVIYWRRLDGYTHSTIANRGAPRTSGTQSQHYRRRHISRNEDYMATSLRNNCTSLVAVEYDNIDGHSSSACASHSRRLFGS